MRNLVSRFKKPKSDLPIFRWISLFSIIYLVYYLIWRSTETLNPDAIIFSWMLLFAEVFGVFNYLLFSWMARDISPKYPHNMPKKGIKVDVFVPTYNEGLDILESTIIGCNNITYPHTTYILDDGNRAEVRELARKLDVEYIARTENIHAKAGNINNALKMTDGEFIIVLDCDMVPQPDYLERTLGYFEHEDLAFIQMPQEFYNGDSIQHDQKQNTWHEQSLFYRVIQPGKNKTNSAFWCGSPSIIRRKAIEEVGGIATETITEDIHTSVRLHSKGWKSLFLNEALAYGIAPQTIKTFLLQRLRWAQGTMQLYRSKESPVWVPGLTLAQRLSYLSSFMAYFEAFQKLMLILTPTVILLFKIYPISVYLPEFLLRWIPYFGLTILANVIGGRGYFKYFQTEKYNLLKMIIFIQSTITLIYKKPLSFKVSPKSVNNSVYKDERRALRGYFVLFGVIAGAVIYGMIGIFLAGSIQDNLFTYVPAIFWASYNALIILLGIMEVLKKKHERKNYRFPLSITAELLSSDRTTKIATVAMENISALGAGFTSAHVVEKKDNGYILHLSPTEGSRLYLPIKKIHYQGELETAGTRSGVSFDRMNSLEKSRFHYFLFITLPKIISRNSRETKSSSIFSFLFQNSKKQNLTLNPITDKKDS